MSGPTYISHPSLWEQFRHTQRGENFVPSIQRKRQRGSGILNRHRAYMIPVKHLATPETKLQQVTPVAAERERAQSNLKTYKKEISTETPQSVFDLQREKTCPGTEEKNN